MQKNRLYEALLASDAASGLISETASATILKMFIGNYKEFDLTVRSSASSGFTYSIETAPVDEDLLFITATQGVFDDAAGTATIVNTFRNNNQNWLRVLASTTAAAREISMTNVRIFFNSVERL